MFRGFMRVLTLCGRVHFHCASPNKRCWQWRWRWLKQFVVIVIVAAASSFLFSFFVTASNAVESFSRSKLSISHECVFRSRSFSPSLSLSLWLVRTLSLWFVSLLLILLFFFYSLLSSYTRFCCYYYIMHPFNSPQFIHTNIHTAIQSGSFSFSFVIVRRIFALGSVLQCGSSAAVVAVFDTRPDNQSCQYYVCPTHWMEHTEWTMKNTKNRSSQNIRECMCVCIVLRYYFFLALRHRCTSESYVASSVIRLLVALTKRY